MKILDVPQSGSQSGITSSHNRFGQYRRTRAIPVNPASAKQGAVRARLGANSAAWRDLTDEQRAGWASLGSQVTRTDALGQSYTLTGFQAFVSVNNNLLAAGDAGITTAGGVTTPTALATATITLTIAAFSIAYTATPLGTGAKLFVYVSPQRSPGRAFEGDLRLLKVGGAAGASPLAVFEDYEDRFGIPVVGNAIFVSLQVHKEGFLSAALLKKCVVA